MLEFYDSNQYKQNAVGCGMYSKMCTPLMFGHSGHASGGTRSNCFYYCKRKRNSQLVFSNKVQAQW
jgi:hypothetical protein